MTVIAGYMVPGTSETKHIILVKGAPETIKEMVGLFLECQKIVTMNKWCKPVSLSNLE